MSIALANYIKPLMNELYKPEEIKNNEDWNLIEATSSKGGSLKFKEKTVLIHFNWDAKDRFAAMSGNTLNIYWHDGLDTEFMQRLINMFKLDIHLGERYDENQRKYKWMSTYNDMCKCFTEHRLEFSLKDQSHETW